MAAGEDFEPISITAVKIPKEPLATGITALGLGGAAVLAIMGFTKTATLLGAAVVGDTLARQMWPGYRDAMGRPLTRGYFAGYHRPRRTINRFNDYTTQRQARDGGPI